MGSMDLDKIEERFGHFKGIEIIVDNDEVRDQTIVTIKSRHCDFRMQNRFNNYDIRHQYSTYECMYLIDEMLKEFKQAFIMEAPRPKTRYLNLDELRIEDEWASIKEKLSPVPDAPIDNETLGVF